VLNFGITRHSSGTAPNTRVYVTGLLRSAVEHGVHACVQIRIEICCDLEHSRNLKIMCHELYSASAGDWDLRLHCDRLTSFCFLIVLVTTWWPIQPDKQFPNFTTVITKDCHLPPCPIFLLRSKLILSSNRRSNRGLAGFETKFLHRFFVHPCMLHPLSIMSFEIRCYFSNVIS
jgi:hypothetical protein